jgi:hypothetical protein
MHFYTETISKVLVFNDTTCEKLVCERVTICARKRRVAAERHKNKSGGQKRMATRALMPLRQVMANSTFGVRSTRRMTNAKSHCSRQYN